MKALLSAMYSIVDIDKLLDRIIGEYTPTERSLRSEKEVAYLKERAAKKRARKAAMRARVFEEETE